MKTLQLLRKIPVDNSPTDYRKTVAKLDLLLQQISDLFCDIERLKLETALKSIRG